MIVFSVDMSALPAYSTEAHPLRFVTILDPARVCHQSMPRVEPERLVSSKVGLGPRFQLLFAASVVSMLGDGIRLAALLLLATHVSRNPLLVSMVAMAGRLPWLVFGLIAG